LGLTIQRNLTVCQQNKLQYKAGLKSNWVINKLCYQIQVWGFIIKNIEMLTFCKSAIKTFNQFIGKSGGKS
jgi:hypothetical protein